MFATVDGSACAPAFLPNPFQSQDFFTEVEFIDFAALCFGPEDFRMGASSAESRGAAASSPSKCNFQGKFLCPVAINPRFGQQMRCNSNSSAERF